jgi:peptide deformylase
MRRKKALSIYQRLEKRKA